MIDKTFVHIPGIGSGTERKLWSRGILDWDRLRSQAGEVFGEKRGELIRGILDESRLAAESGDLNFFARSLPRDQLWRLLPGRFDRIAYLDIETTGTGFPPHSHSTTITFWYRGELLQEYEPSRKEALIRRMLEEPTMWATFFGAGFDVPFLEKEYGFKLEKPHLDLCFWLRRHGFKGGLKKVQKQFPEIPDRLSMDINGYDAVVLWRMHRRGVKRALETLLTYNAEDTVVLEALLTKAYNLEVEAHPDFALSALPIPSSPKLPTEVCPQVYAMLRGMPADSIT